MQEKKNQKVNRVLRKTNLQSLTYQEQLLWKAKGLSITRLGITTKLIEDTQGQLQAKEHKTQ
jgi:hypothetical protein